MSIVPAYLSDWMTAQRWYAGKSRDPHWERIGGYELDDASGEARITVHLLLDVALPPLLYQVPITERTEPLAGYEHALIARVGEGADIRYIYDGPRDPACAAAILTLLLEEGEALPDDGDPGIGARGHSTVPAGTLAVGSSRVLSGEQSNTSIIFDMSTADGSPAAPVICKLFRSLHHGENPDVTLLGALGGVGSTVVPTSVGHITGQWRDTGQPAGFAHGHLAFAQEFFPGVQDAWRVALLAAETDDDFTERARTLGAATAEVHTALASALPAHEASRTDISSTIASMRGRFDLAAEEVPVIERYRAALAGVYARAESSVWPPMQRIHGDFHLGQVLAVPEVGWIILDFEGEPMRPMTERSLPDSPLRDIAGMLRSFDYVAGSVVQTHPDVPVAAWTSDARRAFLDGYIASSGYDVRADRALLDAFEIDKALYEAVYEARNRPDWLGIPLAAIERLVTRAATPRP
ncbi:MAG: phosphotransferase [Burkholderiaceae bacterium]|nr:phosphotransferase [Microbacteriaceae bacterium]